MNMEDTRGFNTKGKMKIYRIATLLFFFVIALLVLLLSGCAGMDFYNESDMKFNYMEKTWSYEPANSELRWNYMDKKWEWVAK